MVACEQPFQELHAETGESIAVGNHNFLDSAATDGFQKGKQSGTLPVETTGGVLDEFVSGIDVLEVCTLTNEVGVLVLGADPGVANATAWRLFLEGCPKEGTDVVKTVESFASIAPRADGFNFTLICPLAKRAWANIVRLSDGCATDKSRIQWKCVFS